jgi:hypothetical protein
VRRARWIVDNQSTSAGAARRYGGPNLYFESSGFGYLFSLYLGFGCLAVEREGGLYSAVPASSKMILSELSISNQRCAVAYFRPALYCSTLPPAATNAELAGIGVLADRDFLRSHDF